MSPTATCFDDRPAAVDPGPARWYDPSTERWITEDPIFPESGPNAYEYCGNDPVNNVDPAGLAGEPAAAPGPIESMLNAPLGSMPVVVEPPADNSLADAINNPLTMQPNLPANPAPNPANAPFSTKIETPLLTVQIPPEGQSIYEALLKALAKYGLGQYNREPWDEQLGASNLGDIDFSELSFESDTLPRLTDGARLGLPSLGYNTSTGVASAKIGFKFGAGDFTEPFAGFQAGVSAGFQAGLTATPVTMGANISGSVGVPLGGGATANFGAGYTGPFDGAPGSWNAGGTINVPIGGSGHP